MGSLGEADFDRDRSLISDELLELTLNIGLRETTNFIWLYLDASLNIINALLFSISATFLPLTIKRWSARLSLSCPRNSNCVSSK
jgi:hypothetical protein